MQIMSIAELQEALDSHGSDLTAWPVELRDSATTLIANSNEARRHMEVAAKTDRALRAPAGKAPANFARRIVRTAFQSSRPGKNIHPHK